MTNSNNVQENNKKSKVGKIITGGIIAILILIILFLLFKMNSADNNATTSQNIVYVTEPAPIVEETKMEHQDGQVDLPLLSDFSVNENNQFKKLKNPSSNAGFYTVEYQFYYENETEPFFVSDKIEGGYEYLVNFYEILETGTHNVNVIVQPYNVVDDTPCNNISVNITVEKV